MNTSRVLAGCAAALLLLAAGFWIGRGVQTPQAEHDSAPMQPRKPLYYRNPMGLPDTSPVPKKDAMGMDYIPVYAEDEMAASPGTVALSSERIQTLGVRTEPTRRQPLADTLRASGTITIDETRQHAIAPRFDGWVDTLVANQTGMRVRRRQILLTVYSPRLLAAQEDYRVADAALRQLGSDDPTSRLAMRRLRDAAQGRLRNFGISVDQLEHLAHQPPGNLAITAPTSGVIVDKPVVAGARFAAGETILRIADLSTVWIMVNVPAAQIDRVRLGQRAEFSTPALPGQRFMGQVGFLQPVLDAASRTLAVRVALPNPDGVLRPGLFGQVTLESADVVPVLTVPRSALIDSGTRQLVLVQVSNGRFAPRSVTVGRRADSMVEILAGLAEGERVVAEGNFLIDAESNLRAALANLTPVPTPGSGLNRPASTPADHAGHAGHAAPDAAAGSHAEHAQPPTDAPSHANHAMEH